MADGERIRKSAEKGENGDSGENETLEGTVENIIYQNSANGYTVLEMSVDGSDLPRTVVGIIPQIAEGETIKVMGKWQLHPTFGKQLKADYYERRQPVGTQAILRYLSSGAIKGIGPKTASRIVERFKDDTLAVLENNPDFLSDVEGISPKKASEIGKIYKEQFGMRNVIMFAGEFFGTALAVKIYKQWGSAAVDIIKSNPFALCESIDGIGFVKADKVALSLGCAQDSPERLKSGIKYVLSFNASNNGHTFIPSGKLKEASANLLGVDIENIEKAYGELLLSGDIVEVKHANTACTYLKEYKEAEEYICAKLDLLEKTAASLSSDDIGRFIEQTEMMNGIEYAAMQKKAISDAVTNGVMILTGGPGTGKTTVIKAVIEILRKMGYKVALAAPTGRAAKRMSEATGEEAKTIHRLLETEFGGGEKAVFRRNKENLLDENVIIIDESSMVDTLLLKALLEAVKPGGRLILIGDADQLPSVGAGNVLNDLIKSERFSTVRLKDIFRQAKESRIITNAHAINSGEYPVLTDKNSDFFFINREDEGTIADTVVSLCSQRLPKKYGKDIVNDIQVITPSKKGVAGTQILNMKLQASLNPPSLAKKEKKTGDRIFREGDKVMQIKNNYDLKWEKKGKEGSGIFNGDIGFIDSIDVKNEKMMIDFDGRETEYDFCMLEELEHAYAITIHKSQGSEYKIVIIPLFKNTPLLLTRELFYTAVTRAQKMVILVGNPQVAMMMVDNSRRPMRYTGIKYFMKDYMNGNE